MILTIVILSVIVACLIVALIMQAKKGEKLAMANGRIHEMENQLAAKEQSLQQITSQLNKANIELAQARTSAAVAEERLSGLREEREKIEKLSQEQFKNLASEIFASQSGRFRAETEQRLADILSPLRENINDFRKTFGEAYTSEAKERFSLQREIQKLMELNLSIGKEAKELAQALKGDSKVQGDWGEMILERLLEMSGLKKGIHFKTQLTENPDGTKICDENGDSLRPDVVVFYPDDRCVVVDSKVSLSAYVDYINAEGTDDAGAAAKRHVRSVRHHIDELAQKRYQDLVGEKKLDFVVMFIPNEGAYFAIMKLEPALWEEAYGKRVLIASPTHLISMLRLLEQLWKQDAINRNVQEIARLSGTMVDKIANFISDFDAAEKALNSAQGAYQQARKRLTEGRGNVLTTANKIVALGAKNTRRLPTATDADADSTEE